MGLVEIIQETEAELIAAHASDDVRYARRIGVWHLRLQGFVIFEIAKQLGLSTSVVHDDLNWCRQNLAVARDGIEELADLSLERLEMQYRQLAPLREMRNEAGHRLSLNIIDLQAKLMGLYKTRIEVSIPNFTVNGVDPKALQ